MLQHTRWKYEPRFSLSLSLFLYYFLFPVPFSFFLYPTLTRPYQHSLFSSHLYLFRMLIFLFVRMEWHRPFPCFRFSLSLSLSSLILNFNDQGLLRFTKTSLSVIWSFTLVYLYVCICVIYVYIFVIFMCVYLCVYISLPTQHLPLSFTLSHFSQISFADWAQYCKTFFVATNTTYWKLKQYFNAIFEAFKFFHLPTNFDHLVKQIEVLIFLKSWIKLLLGKKVFQHWPLVESFPCSREHLITGIIYSYLSHPVSI